MRRYLSLKSNSTHRASGVPASVIESEKSISGDTTEQSTIIPSAQAPPIPPPTFKVKKVDYYYSRWQKKWKYENTGSNIIPELRTAPESDGKNDPWQPYCFVVVRTIPREQDKDPHFKVVVKSPYLLTACKEVIQEIVGLSWNSIPLELEPQLLLSFLPQFEDYRKTKRAKGQLSEEDGYVLSSVDTLIDYLRKDYRSTIAAIENLTSHGEITFELLYAIMVPRSILIITCPMTGELQALRLVSANKIVTAAGCAAYVLVCNGIGVEDIKDTTARSFLKTQSRVVISEFEGTVNVTSLDAYPIKFHPREAELKESLIARGRKWSEFIGIHHMYYKGTAGFRTSQGIVKYNLDSRIMIDRANFRRINANYQFPMPVPQVFTQQSLDPYGDGTSSDIPQRPLRRPTRRSVANSMQPTAYDGIPLHGGNKPIHESLTLTDEDFLITPPILWGFSLADKLWLEFNIDKIEPIEWNPEAFANLVLANNKKMLLQSLVEAHNAELSGFDDFIKGKGRGLVINLFGPPGVGKTMSAEATSEHVKRPLYVVGAGDLGIRAADLDTALQRVFELATAWKAIVLIDEADVFLEQRSLHELERNAMVAVFLRHLEYYPAILFMTTNRVETFDEAFLSRIHVAFHFDALSKSTRAQVWTAFLGKAGLKVGVEGGITEDELTKLTEREINGRQVKNATRTANSLASSRGETLQYSHLVEALDIMDQFSRAFHGHSNAMLGYV